MRSKPLAAGIRAAISPTAPAAATKSSPRPTTTPEVFSPAPGPRPLQNIPAQILVLHNVGQLLADVGGVHSHGFLLQVGAFEGDFLQHLLHDGVQAARADVLGAFVDLGGELRHLCQRVVGQDQFDAFGFEQRGVLLGQRVFRLLQDADEIHAVARIHGGALDDGEDVALYALAAHVRPVPAFAPRVFVDFVEEDDAARSHALQRHAGHLVHVDELLLLLLHQVIERLGHAHFAAARLLAEEAGQHVLDVDAHLLDPGVAGDLERGGAILHLDLHQAFVQLALAQALTEFLAGALDAFARLRLRRHEQVEEAVLGVHFGAVRHLVEPLFPHYVDRDIHQVADHRFHVASHVAHFGELAGFDLEERRVGETRQAAGQLRLAHARGADHEDVLGHDLFGHFGRELLAPDAVTQGDGHGALGIGLPHHVLLQFAHDFPGSQLIEQRLLIHRLGWKIDHHYSNSSNVTLSFV